MKPSRLLGAICVVAVLMTLTAVPASADPVPVPPAASTPDVVGPYTVDTSATVGTTGGGGLAGPSIECKWELVDMDRAFLGDSTTGTWFYDEAIRQTGNSSFPRVGQLTSYSMDYAWQDAAGNWWFDDDPTSGPHPQDACRITVLGVTQDGDASEMIQVFANAGDATGPGGDGVFGTGDDVNRGTAGNPIGERIIELWAAVRPPGADPADIQQVYWDVYHPDGTKKAQVHDRTGHGADVCRNGYHGFLGAGEAVPFDPSSFGIKDEDTVMGAALGTGQMSAAVLEEIVTECAQQQAKLYQSHFTLSKHQPCGEYAVVAHAVPVIGPEDTLRNYFDVLCFVHLDIDYTSVEWTGVNTTGWANFEGDFDMGTPDLPTAINAGSGGLTVRVEFFPMESYEDLNGNTLTGKWLEEFDVSFGVSESSLVPLTVGGDPIIRTDQNDPTAGVTTDVNTSSGAILCANEPGKFIYSLHTEGALPGRYAGTINVSAVPSTFLVCQNTRGIWGGYHDLGPDGQPDGGGPGAAPVSPGNFDDDYGRNQRSVVNP
jgi:hypothetical protein